LTFQIRVIKKMADAKKLERSYTIPLRREFLKVPKYKRAKKATTAVKQFLAKHMKSDDIKLSTKINEEVWKHGIKNPPSKVRVTAVKDEKGVVSAELFGAKVEAPAPKKKSDAKKVTEKESPKVKAAPITTETKETPVASEAKE
jgi:large subunit ribosomal protein L31e